MTAAVDARPEIRLRAILYINNYSLYNYSLEIDLTIDRISRITDCNFTVRMLYCNMY